MRDEFLKAIIEEVERDSSIILLTADLGFGVFEDFEKKFPKQFINVGVAEQNMVGVATGLSLEGFKTITYSIGNFPTLRCLEQIRNDACYHEINLTIVGMGGGFSYGSLGMSHHATEDIAIMRALPKINILAPGTKEEAYFATKRAIQSKSVNYLRLDKSYADSSLEISKDFEIGKSITYRNGNDFSIFSTGGILIEAIKAADELKKIGINCRVISFHSLKPIDSDVIKKSISETKGIITIEEHNIIGGLSSAISAYCIQNNYHPKFFKSLALNDEYSSVVGSQEYLKEYYKINSNEIILHIKKYLKI